MGYTNGIFVFVFQVHSDSTPATLQPLHDESGDKATHERHLVGGSLHQLHTYFLERLGGWSVM